MSRLTVSKVTAGTPLGISQIQPGDIVVAIDEVNVESVQDLVGAVSGKSKVCACVCVRYLRRTTNSSSLRCVGVVYRYHH